MQLKNEERERARKLRLQGLSYSEILQHVTVSQSSLSLWLRNVTLSDEQNSKLFLRGPLAGAKARRQQRLNQLAELEKEVSEELPILVKDPFFCIGLALYWAEGSKSKPWRVSVRTRVTNSDPLIILLMRQWFIKFSKDCKLQYRLYIHESADATAARERWAQILAIDPVRISISIKKHEVRTRRTHDKYIGLIELNVRKSARLTRKIELWTKGAATHFLHLETQ